MARKANYFALPCFQVFSRCDLAAPPEPIPGEGGRVYTVAVGNAFQFEERKGSRSLNSSSGEMSSNELWIGGGDLAAGRKVAQNPTVIRYVV